MLSAALRRAKRASDALAQRLAHPAHSYVPLSDLSDADRGYYAREDMAPAREKAWDVSRWSRFCAILLHLVPSFLQDSFRHDTPNPRRLHPTSWLDGLRGVASLIVFFFHFTDDTHNGLLMTYGVKKKGDKTASSPLQLPFVRVIISGKPMVHIFFVISGFVLAYKPLKQIRARQFEALQSTLASSIFRRGFRLLLPPMVSIFAILFLRYYGFILHKARDTLYEQFQECWKEIQFFLGLIWSWDSPKIPKYDTHLWTVPMEMSFSMLLFIIVMGFSRVKPVIRLTSIACIATYLLRQGHYAGWEFLMGVCLAEIQIIQDARRAVLSENSATPILQTAPSAACLSKPARIARLVFQATLLSNLTFALYVAGWPREKWGEDPFIAMLLRHTPEPYASRDGSWPIFFWYAIGAVQIVVALQQIELLRRPFTTGLAQYLGDVSYSLYICHGPVLKVLHHMLMPSLWALAGGRREAHMWGRFAVWFIGLVTLSVPVVWVSDLFMRFVDQKCVNLARWLERRVSI